jgi:hypothetical protein
VSTLSGVERFQRLLEAYRELCPVHIAWKQDSPLMRVIYFLVRGFVPNFMTDFTTVIGKTIYFSGPDYIEEYPDSAARTLAHEMVHLLDSRRCSWPVFVVGYLFPQIFVAGVLLFPWIGVWALLFLVFLLPLPAPFRAWIEVRAYCLNILTAHPAKRARTWEHVMRQFTGWNYYLMMPFPPMLKYWINHSLRRAESGRDATQFRVLHIYEEIMLK